MAEPTFRYDAVASRFRDQTGRFVPERTVRAALDRTLTSGAAATRGLTEGLAAGTLNLAQWQTAMAAEIKASQLAGAALAKGGWSQMAPGDFLFAARRIKEQYARLRNFTEQLASGRQPLDGRALRRAEMYAEAARAANREMERRMARQANLEQERNVLGDADHCDGCLEATAEGWAPIGTLTPIGSRDCLTRCRCTLEYRRGEAA